MHNVEGWGMQKTVNIKTMNCLSCLPSELFPMRATGTAGEEPSIRG